MKPVQTLKRQWRQVFKDYRIACMEINGIIAEQRSLSSTPQALEHLEDIEKQEYKALLLHINSPGGTVGASQALYEKIRELRKKTRLKMVASLGDVAASGGLYVAMAADRIIAHGGTVTGSIGVIIRSGNFRQLLDKIGIQSDVVKSGKFKDILSSERALTGEEKALLQGTIDDTYRQFVEAVAQGRRMEVSRVEALADGRIFSGKQALEYGLIDELGGKDTAIQALKELAGIPAEITPALVMLSKKRSLLSRLAMGEAAGYAKSPQETLGELLHWAQGRDALAGIPLWLMPGG